MGHKRGEIYLISIDYRDARPIYEQIKEKLRRLILNGVIAKDEKLPSVRELATDLTINPNTIMRAYRDLETEGYLYTVQGRGSFAADLQFVDDGRKKQLINQYTDALKELLQLGVGMEELASILHKEAKNID